MYHSKQQLSRAEKKDDKKPELSVADSVKRVTEVVWKVLRQTQKTFWPVKQQHQTSH